MINIFTKQVIRNMEQKLDTFHSIFKTCSVKAEYLEEIIARSLVEDEYLAESGVKVLWTGFSHNASNDIIIQYQNEETHLSLKTGKVTNDDKMSLSGYRLGRFKGDFQAITSYLQEAGSKAIHIAVPSEKIGGHWFYTIYKIEAGTLSPGPIANWIERGAAFNYTAENGVLFSLRPSMSWQVWWTIPLSLMTRVAQLQIRS